MAVNSARTRGRTGGRTGGRHSPSLLARLFRWTVQGVLWFILLSILWVALYIVVPPPITATMAFDSNGAERRWMAIEDIDPDMARAAIAGEDAKFCSHWGFDGDAMRDALRRSAAGGLVRGGSTISQQTAKNVFLWQGSGTISRLARKLPEAWFTILIETLWSKKRIMEVYLNVAETGIGVYGVDAGSRYYFHHDASMMSKVEAARIAAVLPLPKKREAIAPTGFTRRHGNSIAARISVVQRDGLDSCLR